MKQKIDQAQIDAWKKEFPRGVFKAVFNEKEIFFKKPGRLEVEAATTKSTINGGSIMVMCREVAELCYLGGDRDLLQEEDFELGVFEDLYSIIQVTKVNLEKL